MRRTTTGARPAGRSELKAWYKTALADQASSGMSVTAFASRIGVAVSTLYQWRRRLDGSRIRVGRSGPQLLEVALATPATPMPSSSLPVLVVRLCADRRAIEVPQGFDAGELRRVIEALESC